MPSPSTLTGYRFDRFLLEPAERVLSLDGVPVALSSRAFDMLQLLIEHRDRVVTKDEILHAVWPGIVVEENNLPVHVSAIRRALGAQRDGRPFIATVPGRGYRFVASVDEQVRPAPLATPQVRPAVPSPEPEPDGGVAPARPVWRGRRRAALAGAACLVLAMVGLGCLAVMTRTRPPPRLSIAVLPFRNLGADAGQAYLADAISDDLTTDLSHLPGSLVIARESADTFRDRTVRVDAIGRALDVRYLLEGSLRSENGVLHINAQLIDAQTAAHHWASRFDIARNGLPDAQHAIVRHLAGVLDFTLVQIEAARSLHDRPDNPDAVDLFLRARSRLDRDDSFDGLVAAQRQLEQAVAAAPDFSDAMAQLGLVLLRKIGNFDDPDEWQDHAQAVAVIGRAIALKPQSPLAITARGMLGWEDDRCDQALPDFRLALSLDPDAIEAQDGLSECARALGRMQDMIGGLQDLMRIDPAAPDNARRQNLIGLGYLLLDRPRDALDWLDRARSAILPSEPAGAALGWEEWNTLHLIVAEQRVGHPSRAASMFEAYRRLRPHRTITQLAAYDPRAYSTLPGYASYLAALQAVGMPMSLDETVDFGVPPSPAPHSGDDFSPTPVLIPGAGRIDTATLHALLGLPDPPLVLDVGHGARQIPGSILVWPQGVWGDPDRMLEQAAATARGTVVATTSDPPGASRPVVVMGDGPLGWSSYDAALFLVARGFPHVLWYRGGEQSWAAHGFETIDSRPQ